MKRIVFTVATGAPKYIEQALGLGRSLKLIGDTTPRVLMTDVEHPALPRNFDTVVRPPQGVPTYLLKLYALEATDADEVVFIDSDSLAFRRLDRFWQHAAGADFAVQGQWVRDGHWYGWLEEKLPELGLDALPKFNGGLMYYSRTVATERVIEEALRISADYDATGLERFRGTVPDEPCVAIALARTGAGRILPNTSDFMNTPVGLVGRLDMDVYRGRCGFLKHAPDGLRYIRPDILHAAKYVLHTAYWRELAKLEWLEKYEDRHPFGYMPPHHKLQRSVQRRILKTFKGIG